MVLLVREAHRALRFGRRVDELTQRVTRQGVVVAAGADVLEASGLVVPTLRIAAAEQEPLDLVGRVADRAVLRVQLVRVRAQQRAHVGVITRAILLAHLAEHEHLARPEYVRRQPVEGGPVDVQPQIRFSLHREPADRRAVEREVVRRLEQELLVVIEHVQPALEIAEADRHSLDPLLLREVAHALLLHVIRRLAVQPLLFRLEVQLLELFVRNFQEVAQQTT
jgi:hypothetical protein